MPAVTLYVPTLSGLTANWYLLENLRRHLLMTRMAFEVVSSGEMVDCVCLIFIPATGSVALLRDPNARDFMIDFILFLLAGLTGYSARGRCYAALLRGPNARAT